MDIFAAQFHRTKTIYLRLQRFPHVWKWNNLSGALPVEEMWWNAMKCLSSHNETILILARVWNCFTTTGAPPQHAAGALLIFLAPALRTDRVHHWVFPSYFFALTLALSPSTKRQRKTVKVLRESVRFATGCTSDGEHSLTRLTA